MFVRRICHPVIRQLNQPLRTTIKYRFIHVSTQQQMLFEGNTKGIEESEESRMTSIFGGRLKGEPPKSTSRIIVGNSRKIAGIDVPMKPEEPDNCCMSGCVNCVWEIYNDDLRYWRKQRRLAAEDIAMTNDIWPQDWDPPLTALQMKNVPDTLKDKKIKLDKLQEEKKIKSRETVRSLFPKRETPLPKSVLQAKARHEQETHNKDISKTNNILENEEEGWEEVPEHIRAFAEFERKKKLIAKQKKIERRRANPLLAQLKKQEEAYANGNTLLK